MPRQSVVLVRLCLRRVRVGGESTLHPNTLTSDGGVSGPEACCAAGPAIRCGRAEGPSVTVRQGEWAVQDDRRRRDAFTESVLCVGVACVAFTLCETLHRLGLWGCTNTKRNNRSCVVCAFVVPCPPPPLSSVRFYALRQRPTVRQSFSQGHARRGVWGGGQDKSNQQRRRRWRLVRLVPNRLTADVVVGGGAGRADGRRTGRPPEPTSHGP